MKKLKLKSILGSQGTLLGRNNSGRFECRFVSVKIPKETPAIMLKGMEESVMGIWSTHGEGRFEFENQQVKDELVKNNLISLQFVDDDNNPTTKY